MFDIVWSRFIEGMLPMFLRKPKTTAFVTALLSPIIWVYDQFKLNRTQNIIAASTTTQVFSLQKTLNDMYDAQERRIVVDSTQSKQGYIYIEHERRPQYLPITITSGINTDFVVEVPDALLSRKKEIANTVKLYALPSKKFKIIPI